jgi:hypothetical protein
MSRPVWCFVLLKAFCALLLLGRTTPVDGSSPTNTPRIVARSRTDGLGLVAAGAWSRAVRVRGGSDKLLPNSTVHSVVAVFHLGAEDTDGSEASSLSWLVGGNYTPYSAILLGEKATETPILRIPRLPQDETMMTSLGIVSDVIIVVLPADAKQAFPLLDGVSERLVTIADATDVQRLPRKKRLVVVSESANDSWWVEEVVKQRLQSITPLSWEIFDILTPQQLETQWQSGSLLLRSDEDRDSSESVIRGLIPYDNNAQAFVRLVEQIYRYKSENGGTEMDDSVGDDSSFFMLEAVPMPSITTTAALPKTERKQRVVSAASPSFEDPQDRIQRVLQTAQGKVADLESKMQEILLESQSTNNQMPLLDFGGTANDILEGAYRELEQFPPSVRTGFMSRLVFEVHRLYKEQLQSLRDYYGRRYELSLEQEEEESIWATEAEHMTQGFQTAAQHAVPSLCQVDSALANIVSFDSIHAMQGLLQDMLEATQLRKDEQSLAFDEDDLEDLATKRRRFPPWVKKIASRAVALGINYLQGWLAWQGVKRAALERDREMPKFPLF